MAMSSAHLLTQTAFFPLLILISLLTLSHSQLTPTNPSPPTMAECGPRLVVLAPCAPFVQGQSPGPTQQCCDNLVQAYNQERGCLCLFLNGTALASLPVNSTLALQLPGLCSPQIDPSTCSPSEVGSAPPTSPSSQASFQKSPSADAAAGAPTITVAPRPSTARFGLGKSSSAYKVVGSHWGIAVPMIFLLLEKLL